MRIKRKIVPDRSRANLKRSADFGKKAKRTFEPSKGGSGTKLKIPSTIFVKTIMLKNWSIEESQSGPEEIA